MRLDVRILFPLLLALSLALTLTACEDDPVMDENTENDMSGGFCEIGTLGCSCTSSFPCREENVVCTEGICVMCPDGDESCACKTDGTCNGDLACTAPPPEECSFSGCAESTCQVAMCGPTQLCTRTIDDCGENLTLEACEGFYANEANCADMAAYTACNCECVTRGTCEAYFACGNNCFNEHCM